MAAKNKRHHRVLTPAGSWLWDTGKHRREVRVQQKAEKVKRKVSNRGTHGC